MSAFLTINGRFLFAGVSPLIVSVGRPESSDNGTGAASPSGIADGRIFQRVGYSKVVPVSATVTGADGAIEMRVIIAATGVAVTAWAVVGVSSGGTVAGTLDVPQGAGMYKLQARKASNPGLITTGTAQFGVGALVAFLGQSNMRNLSQHVDQYPLADLAARRWTGSGWGYVGNYNLSGTYPPGTPYSVYGSNRSDVEPRGDGIVYCVNALRAGLGVVVGVLEYAVNGTNIGQWQDGGNCWEPFEAAVAAVGGDFELCFWYQGEDNANLGTSAASYQASLANVMNNCRAITGRSAPDLPFGVVTLGPTTNYGPEGSFGTMRAAQLAFVAANASAFLAGVATDGADTDGVHLDPVSQGRMGKRYAKAALAYRSGAAKPGPSVSGATRSGNLVTVSIVGGTGALKDGAGGGGASLKGFRGFNGSTPVSINSTSIAGSTVQIMFAGPVTSLDYAMANAPYSRPPLPQEILYDSDTVPGDTRGLPLQPCSLLEVT